jgi:hypothetical protein
MRLLHCFFASLLVIGLAAASACGSSDNPPGNTVNAGGSGASAGGSGGGGALGGLGGIAGNVSVDSGGGASGRDSGIDGPVCGAVEHTSAQKPVDLFIMLDKSASMVTPPPAPAGIWNDVKNAIIAFVQAPEANGIGVGLGQFPQGFDEPQVCQIPNYARPTVAIAPLPGAAGAITTAINAIVPNGNTPTSAALQGALQYAKTWAAAHLDRQTIVVLATDGDPTQCEPTATALIQQFAADALAQPPAVFTFVIGIGDLGNLNPIAEGGGTKQAFIINPGQQNVAQEITKALLRIATSPLGCEFPIPPPKDGGLLNTKLVNVDFTPSDGTPKHELVQVANAGECGRVNNGWYYDNAVPPTRIFICPSACNAFGAGTLEIVLGCQTRVPL